MVHRWITETERSLGLGEILELESLECERKVLKSSAKADHSVIRVCSHDGLAYNEIHPSVGEQN